MRGVSLLALSFSLPIQQLSVLEASHVMYLVETNLFGNLLVF